ncbi:PREDICTED: arginine--tRNA ligase, cytoplasmic-like isoform X2 [Ipomoea nil]|uniref:arginine--tRNA ligase, cytoplasmic-like isoform X2 n=1 Tax=Ipomoea nil TaxID=35883 RepID=UPI00090156DC|nr:PREDICTED: arginine--tRNA ligase, cytoplasmic-like isoform X2 [Ipomoea nil]
MLGLHLLQFPEVVEEACTNLLPNLLCEYLYNLSEDFTRFYTNCQVVGSAQETSRLLLCEATTVVMRKCFHLLAMWSNGPLSNRLRRERLGSLMKKVILKWWQKSLIKLSFNLGLITNPVPLCTTFVFLCLATLNLCS